MNIFFLNYALTIFWGILLLYSASEELSAKKKAKRKLIFVVIVCAQWILISGLRADSVGADTFNYMHLFDWHIQWNWSAVLTNLRQYYAMGASTRANNYEPGYILLEKTIGIFTTSHIAYKFIIATLFMTALGRFIYQNSDDPMVSFMVYDAIFYNMFSLTGYRQVVSAAIGILAAYEYVKKRKLIPFVLLVLLASLFHKSTLVFLLFYPLANKKITQKYIVVSAVIIGIMIAFRNQLFEFVKVLVGYDQYSGLYGFAQGTFTFLLILLTLAVIYFRPQIVRCNRNADHYYNGMILTWTMMPFAMVSPTSMRLVYDFGFLPFLLLIPTLARSFRKKRNRLLVYGFLILLFGYFVLKKTPAYFFYWQVP